MNKNKLKGKRAVVIGGGRGICKVIAKTFLENGVKVLIVSSKQADVDASRRDLSAFGEVSAFTANIGDKAQVRALAEEVKKVWGTLDILVNGASISGPIGPVIENDPEEWQKAIQINLTGTFYAMRFLGPFMKKSGGAMINFVGGGEGPYENYTSYVAAKGGITRLTETSAVELKKYNIRVNAIAPGAVNTKFLDDLLTAGPEKAGKANYERALKQKAEGGVSPEKAAMLVLFLVSDDAKELTGKIFSAVWDSYLEFPKHLKDIRGSDVYTMRRVRPKDRGFTWDPNS